YPHNPTTWTDPLGLTPCPIKEAWVRKADFSNQKTVSKKFNAHAEDFGISGNWNNSNKAHFIQAMQRHMLSPDVKIYRFDYRGQGPAVGFVDPGGNLMVMLRSDGRFWSGWRLGEAQFTGIVQRGRLN
ncbi:hypothetical protein FNQ90_20190, partial [Streptomyces alkaliphilus]